MKVCLIMYNIEADKEIFAILKTNPTIKHYIKWNDVKGTGSGGLQVMALIDEKNYSVVLVALEDTHAEQLYQDIIQLREKMLNPTGIAILMLQAEKIG